jgi:NADPH-dependent glutamate synthase beta subunit-like oxidoreductase
VSKLIVFKSVDELPEVPVSQASMSWNKTGSWRSSTPRHENITPPCNFNCPAGEDIRGYIDLVKKNRVSEAFDLLTAANPLPAVCGRVCFHPCQAHCNRHQFDTELQVRLLEKFIGDWGIENRKLPDPPHSITGNIAVIGAGPAGLAAAYYLRKNGIGAVVYDENSLPGGILHYGIPSYRLEKDVLGDELTRVLTGIEFKPNMKFGSDLDIGDLESFDAVFLATGAHMSKRMRVEGENQSGVQSGLDFLKDVNSGGAVDLDGKQVMVIGGGNTACDVARTAYRLGARVQLVYRRTEKEMPAFAEEIEQLKAEPIDLQFLAAPERIGRNSDGRLTVVLHRMKPGEPDESGRARSIKVEGSQFDQPADIVYTAIGEDPDLSSWPGVRQASGGEYDFSEVEPHLSRKLFVGGDILPNPRTVPHAVASGRLAAEKIAAFLRGEELTAPERVSAVAGPDDVNLNYFTRVNAAKWVEGITVGDSISDQEAAIAEAARCFSCGVCNECNNCYNFCPDLAVIKAPGGYQVNLDYCKGCGICTNECPSGSLKLGKGWRG